MQVAESVLGSSGTGCLAAKAGAESTDRAKAAKVRRIRLRTASFFEFGMFATTFTTVSDKDLCTGNSVLKETGGNLNSGCKCMQQKKLMVLLAWCCDL